MRVAIVHDWLPLYGGAERVLEQIVDVFPDADLFSIIDALPADQRWFIRNKPVRTSIVQRLPLGKRIYRHYFPFMPFAVEQFDLSSYDLIISSSYAFAKGVVTGPDQLHLCYCHSPIRFAWDMQHQYLREGIGGNRIMRVLLRGLLHYIRLWDVRTASGVDSFAANSEYIARRIAKVYRRPATVIYPPVKVDALPLHEEKEDFYLTASRMVPYKRIDLIVEAFSQMPDKKLVVIGDGPEWQKVAGKAGKNVEMLGYQPPEALRHYLQRARAFVFAAEEDFGIAPIEAQACGTPVIAFGKGGVTESIIPGETGLFFREQTCESLRRAVSEFELMPHRFDPIRIRKNAERFSVSHFRSQFAAFVEREWDKFDANTRSYPAKPELVTAGDILPLAEIA
jgi:glycosyltransferase involved in cell wall biosynthesis